VDDPAPMPPQVPMPPELNPLALLDTMMKHNFGLIRLADRKAQVLLRLNLALFMVAFIGVPPTMSALKKALFDGPLMASLYVVVVIIYVVCAACLLVAIMKIVAVIRPRLVIDEDRQAELFYGAVARLKPEEFRRRFHELDFDETVEDMITQVHSTAVITNHKYEKLNDAISWMLSGGLFGIAFALILLITIGLT
jgi:hypothetical protein